MPRLLALSLALAAWLCSASPAAAQPLGQPSGPVILTISGAIERGNSTDPQGRPIASFDQSMLEALPQAGFSTTTPWHKGVVRFDGVSGKALMQAVRAKADGTAHVIALNDYASSMPVSDFMERDPVLALKLNGNYMSVREKGPLFLIFPFDSDAALRSETYYTRSVWQARRIEIR